MPHGKNAAATGDATQASLVVDPLATAVAHAQVGGSTQPTTPANVAENSFENAEANGMLRKLQLDLVALRDEKDAAQAELVETKVQLTHALAEVEASKGDKNKSVTPREFDPSFPHIVVDRFVAHGASGTVVREAGVTEKDPHVLRHLHHLGAKLVRV